MGAPYENEGTGAVYIYNGYSGGVWPMYTQHILAKDVGSGLKAFGAALTLRTIAPGDGMLICIHNSLTDFFCLLL